MFATKFDEDTKEWSGRNVLPIYNPKISLAQVILTTLNTHGPKIAQVLI